jgi:proteasome lid subunit RPN8/RPN11
MENQPILLSPEPGHSPRWTYAPDRCAIRWRSVVEDDTETGLDVYVSQKAYIRSCAHAGSDLENEVGGWLVGKWCIDKRTERQFIVVEGILPAPHVRHGGTYLTFTQDTQVTLLAVKEQRYPGKDLVGWYHTHPRMGIFLSQYDVWLHDNFFPQPYQVALVIEPHASLGGFFIRNRENHLDPRQYYGFYELHNRSHRSVVHWRNVFPEMDMEQGE